MWSTNGLMNYILLITRGLSLKIARGSRKIHGETLQHFKNSNSNLFQVQVSNYQPHKKTIYLYISKVISIHVGIWFFFAILKKFKKTFRLIYSRFPRKNWKRFAPWFYVHQDLRDFLKEFNTVMHHCYLIIGVIVIIIKTEKKAI